ncbi:MAG: PQQ-binding-like beta-propeller repeat protein [Cellulomonas sp.]|nr:PQQ-binding-like beta-propeller repeat protein [Cellulomonas sp.]
MPRPGGHLTAKLCRIGGLGFATVLLIGGCTSSNQASTASTSPTTSPTAAAASAPSATAVTTPMEVGAIADVPRAPQPLWTVTLRDLVPGWSEGGDPTLGDVAAVPHALPGFRGVGIGGVLILGLGSIVEDHLVGIDAMTGAVLWHIGPDGVDGRQTSTCVGESPDHLVVCMGRSDSGEPQIQLLDPATGRLARTIPLGFDAHSIGVSGHLVMAHGPGQDGDSARRDGIDLTTGETAWSVVTPGGAPLPDVTGDPVAMTDVRGETATLSGLAYVVAIDVRTGAELDPRLTSTSVARPDGLVTGFDPNGTHSASLAGGPLVDITGRRLDVPDIWNHPAPGRTPIFASAEPGGSATGQRTDTFDAVDPLDGTQLWSVDTLSATAVGVIGDAVVVRDADHVSLLDQRTGAVRWVVPGDVVGFDGNHLLVVTRDATTDVPTFTLTSVEIAKGSARWSAPAPRGYLVTVGDQILAIDDTSLTGFGR